MSTTEQKRCTWREVLEAAYPIPNPAESYEDWERFTHHDLRCMTRAELLRERERARWRVVFDDAPDAWLIERLDEIEGALNAS